MATNSRKAFRHHGETHSPVLQGCVTLVDLPASWGSQGIASCREDDDDSLKKMNKAKMMMTPWGKMNKAKMMMTDLDKWSLTPSQLWQFWVVSDSESRDDDDSLEKWTNN